MGVSKDIAKRVGEVGAASRQRTAVNTEYLKREIAIAEAEQREIDSRLEGLRSALAALDGHGPDIRRLRLVDAAAYLIARNRAPMNTRELVAALARCGFRTTYNSLATTLRQSSATNGPVQRLQRGVWTTRIERADHPD